MKKNLTRRELIAYTKAHRKAYRDTEKELTGKISLSSFFHDIDKLFLYRILPDKVVQYIHRKISDHHVEYMFGKVKYKKMIIDCESARKTKPDKPHNAIETFRRFYDHMHLIDALTEFEELGLIKSYTLVFVTDKIKAKIKAYDNDRNEYDVDIEYKVDDILKWIKRRTWKWRMLFQLKKE